MCRNGFRPRPRSRFGPTRSVSRIVRQIWRIRCGGGGVRRARRRRWTSRRGTARQRHWAGRARPASPSVVGLTAAGGWPSGAAPAGRSSRTNGGGYWLRPTDRATPFASAAAVGCARSTTTSVGTGTTPAQLPTERVSRQNSFCVDIRAAAAFPAFARNHSRRQSYSCCRCRLSTFVSIKFLSRPVDQLIGSDAQNSH